MLPRSSIPSLIRPFLTMSSWLDQALHAIHRCRGEIVFAGLILFTSAVSVHDAMLVVLLEDIVLETEQNPIGRWLIELNGGDVWLFVGFKLVGTALCGATLLTLYEVRRHVAKTAAIAVACFQCGLLIYLFSR
jgi:hypothetical protein